MAPGHVLDSCEPHAGSVVSTCATVHAFAPPAGSVEVITFPALSNATHNRTDGHAIPTPPFDPLSTCETVQAAAPSAGSVDAITFPVPPSNPTQSDTDGHAIGATSLR